VSSYRPSDFFDNIEPLFRRPRRGGRPPTFTGWHPSPSTRRALWIIAIFVILLSVIGPLIATYTDWAWFKSLGYDSVFLTRLRLQFVLGLVAFVAATSIVLGNVLIAMRQLGPSALSAIGVRRRILGSTAGWVAVAGSALAGILMSLIASGSWETVAKAFSGATFGQKDQVFSQDLGFYLFALPAYRFLWGWLLGLLILVAVVVGAIYLTRPTTTGQLVLPRPALAHISLLGAALFLLLAVHYRLAMFALLTSHHGVVFGAGYTDLNIRLPMYWVLLVISLLFALALLLNVFRGGVATLIATPVLWILAVVVLLVFVPGAVQFARVKPAEPTLEHDYIQRQIDGTNRAFALDRIEFKNFPDTQKISGDLLTANVNTTDNIRLWDYKPLQDAYAQIQAIGPYYSFLDVDVDRYTVDGAYRQVMISARELNLDKLDANAKSWVNVHLRYTHGYGAAASPVTTTTQEGLPNLILQDLPPTGKLNLAQPQIYFGEGPAAGDYVITGTKEDEVDYQARDSSVSNRWSGKSGVSIGGGLARYAFAFRFGDPNLILSNEITDQSQILFHRNVQDRISTLAPFLTLDQDPYVVVHDGRQVWIQDAYTTSDAYPYSEPTGDKGPNFNYIRNSVKVVVDAYDGTTTFYISDSSDPVVQTYANIFPALFKPMSDMAPDLRDHLRYPQDFFSIQASTLLTYHMHDPLTFYGKSQAWALATETKQQGQPQVTLQPYYVVMKLPGETGEEFVLIQPYTPLNKSNMVAWLGARSDGANYGKLVAFQFPAGRQIVGPGQVASRFDQEPSNSQLFSLLNQQGSQVVRGNTLVIPIGDALLFINPVFTQATGGSAPPELKYVLVADEQNVARGATLAEALQNLTGGAVATIPGPVGPPVPGGGTNAQLIQRAFDLFNDAQAKLRQGDLAGYQKDIDEIGRILSQLKGGASPSPSASPH
jgi:uncharacterized membrane protein (UPF0182 family)